MKFVDAPPPIGGPEDPRSVWMERLRYVTERPGEWAEVYSGTPSACHGARESLRLRRYWIPPGGWEFTVRSFRRGHLSFSRTDHVVGVLYARFLGIDAEDQPKRWTDDVNVSPDALWDQCGRRICPVCERRPLENEHGGSLPHACDPCSRAAAVPGVNHGTAAAYKHGGCRCPDCRAANREAQRIIAKRRYEFPTMDATA